MARNKGTASFSANFEPQVAAPLDARFIVDSLADLTLPATWTANDGGIYAYKGMVVSVHSDTTALNNGLYRLIDVDYTNINNWEKLGAGSGTSDHAALAHLAIDGTDGHTYKPNVLTAYPIKASDYLDQNVLHIRLFFPSDGIEWGKVTSYTESTVDHAIYIQNAIDYAESLEGGRTIKIPAGVYSFKSGIRISSNAIKLVGPGDYWIIGNHATTADLKRGIAHFWAIPGFTDATSALVIYAPLVEWSGYTTPWEAAAASSPPLHDDIQGCEFSGIHIYGNQLAEYGLRVYNCQHSEFHHFAAVDCTIDNVSIGSFWPCAVMEIGAGPFQGYPSVTPNWDTLIQNRWFSTFNKDKFYLASRVKVGTNYYSCKVAHKYDATIYPQGSGAWTTYWYDEGTVDNPHQYTLGGNQSAAFNDFEFFYAGNTLSGNTAYGVTIYKTWMSRLRQFMVVSDKGDGLACYGGDTNQIEEWFSNKVNSDISQFWQHLWTPGRSVIDGEIILYDPAKLWSPFTIGLSRTAQNFTDIYNTTSGLAWYLVSGAYTLDADINVDITAARLTKLGNVQDIYRLCSIYSGCAGFKIRGSFQIYFDTNAAIDGLLDKFFKTGQDVGYCPHGASFDYSASPPIAESEFPIMVYPEWAPAQNRIEQAAFAPNYKLRAAIGNNWDVASRSNRWYGNQTSAYFYGCSADNDILQRFVDVSDYSYYQGPGTAFGKTSNPIAIGSIYYKDAGNGLTLITDLNTGRYANITQKGTTTYSTSDGATANLDGIDSTAGIIYHTVNLNESSLSDSAIYPNNLYLTEEEKAHNFTGVNPITIDSLVLRNTRVNLQNPSAITISNLFLGHLVQMPGPKVTAGATSYGVAISDQGMNVSGGDKIGLYIQSLSGTVSGTKYSLLCDGYAQFSSNISVSGTATINSLIVSPGSDKVQETVRAYSSQVNNISEWQDFYGIVKNRVDSSYRFWQGATPLDCSAMPYSFQNPRTITGVPSGSVILVGANLVLPASPVTTKDYTLTFIPQGPYTLTSTAAYIQNYDGSLINPATAFSLVYSASKVQAVTLHYNGTANTWLMISNGMHRINDHDMSNGLALKSSVLSGYKRNIIDMGDANYNISASETGSVLAYKVITANRTVTLPLWAANLEFELDVAMYGSTGVNVTISAQAGEKVLGNGFAGNGIASTATNGDFVTGLGSAKFRAVYNGSTWPIWQIVFATGAGWISF